MFEDLIISEKSENRVPPVISPDMVSEFWLAFPNRLIFLVRVRAARFRARFWVIYI